MRTDHVVSAPTSSPIMSTMFIFFLILLLFFVWICKTCHIWQFLASIPVMDSSAIPFQSIPGTVLVWVPEYQYFKILAGEFHWNGTRICRNDQNLAGISGASIRACHCSGDEAKKMSGFVPDFLKVSALTKPLKKCPKCVLNLQKVSAPTMQPKKCLEFVLDCLKVSALMMQPKKCLDSVPDFQKCSCKCEAMFPGGQAMFPGCQEMFPGCQQMFPRGQAMFPGR